MLTLPQRVHQLSNIISEVKLYRQIEKDLYKAIWEKDTVRKESLQQKQIVQATKLDSLLKQLDNERT